jgi:hypothetical protein
MKDDEDSSQGLAEVGAAERYCTPTGSDRPSRRLVKILADMVEAAMKRVRKRETVRK